MCVKYKTDKYDTCYIYNSRNIHFDNDLCDCYYS